MSGKTKEINFNNLFSFFKNQEEEQFSSIQDLLKSTGIFLRFKTFDINLVDGLFGNPYKSEDYDYRGLHHLLNSTGLFKGINNYCNQEDSSGIYLGTLNKVFIDSLDLIEITLPQTNQNMLCSLSKISIGQDIFHNNKELILKVINDGFLDIQIKVIKENVSAKERIIFQKLLSQDREIFEDIISKSLFSLQNMLKNQSSIILFNNLFSLSDEEKQELPFLKHEEKISILYKRYNGEYDFLWLHLFLKNIKIFKNDYHSFLQQINKDYSKVIKDSELLLFNLETKKNIIFFDENKI